MNADEREPLFDLRPPLFVNIHVISWLKSFLLGHILSNRYSTARVGAGIPRPIALITDMGGWEYPPYTRVALYRAVE
ncbi:MAG TPA: hypothetical protein VKG02_01160 [Blastocatellia bacterium]|nr:hypothetical protein [Blastocatellia bacterium]